MDKEMSRGDTMLISIDAPTEYPVTTLQDVWSYQDDKMKAISAWNKRA